MDADHNEPAQARWREQVAEQTAALLEAGWIEPTGETLRGQPVYRITPAGLEAEFGGRLVIADG